MAMRLRLVNSKWVALCAAHSVSENGDVYLDDSQDRAIRKKLEADWLSEGYMFDAATEKGTDAGIDKEKIL